MASTKICKLKHLSLRIIYYRLLNTSCIFTYNCWRYCRCDQFQGCRLKVGLLGDKSYCYVCRVGFFFISSWVFFHEHSRFTGQQGKEGGGGGIYLTPLYHFHPLHRHLDISQPITAETSPLHIAGSRTRTGNLWFPSTSR